MTNLQQLRITHHKATEQPYDTHNVIPFFPGTVLFTFQSAAIRLRLDWSRDPRYQGYLGLSQTGVQSYQVVLTKGLDLNTLNPRNPPVSLYKRLVTNYGEGGLQNGRGGHVKFYPYVKGGRKKF